MAWLKAAAPTAERKGAEAGPEEAFEVEAFGGGVKGVREATMKPRAVVTTTMAGRGRALPDVRCRRGRGVRAERGAGWG